MGGNARERHAERAWETDSAIFASRLSSIMKARGLNQVKLANMISSQNEAAGQSLRRQTISLYMSGQSKPDTERLTLLCNALNVSADYLLGRSEDWRPEEEHRFVCEYTGLSGDTVEKLHKWIGISKQLDTSEGDIPDFLSDFLRVKEGIFFLSLLHAVGETVEEEQRRLQGSILSIKELKKSRREINASLFELTDMAKELANALYMTEEVKDKINDAYLESVHMSLEAYNGEHKED